jgi:hypothetical protein
MKVKASQVFLFLSSHLLIALLLTACSTAYYIPAYKQLPSYEQKGNVNIAAMLQQGYTAKGLGGFINAAVSNNLYAGYQYNKHVSNAYVSKAFESNYHEVLFGYFKNGKTSNLMSLDTSFLKAKTIFGCHAGFAYQDWNSNLNATDVFYSRKKIILNKYFLQVSGGTRTRIYEGNYILYVALYNLQSANFQLQSAFDTPSEAEQLLMNEQSKLRRARHNLIYGISYSGSILIQDFRIIFNLNSPNSIASWWKGDYLDFESVNLYVGLQYRFGQKLRKKNEHARL